ncbi:MAG TPA: thiamine-phosphate kinase [Caulobacteraceae bacterium]|jgi:thiamine-monophosphate kinase|nr:thiamine-phosphate kinase [Caulobacteraceae bacterium]
MSAPERKQGPVDEFDWIARHLRPLAAGAPEALGLVDDAAAIPSRPGFDLVISKDAIVAGVHFLPDDPLDLVARKLLRVNLSDLAAKGAEPYGYFLAVAWPAGGTWPEREAFTRGLKADQETFGLKLFGGDTVSTPGPLTASATILGWVPAGGMVRRSTAKPGDVVLVTGSIGDGGLGLAVARGEGLDLSVSEAAWLNDRYHLPAPRLAVGAALRRWAHAAADVSDGLIADAGHIAEASGVRITLDLDSMPLSAPATAWLGARADLLAARQRLATCGDDYEVLCTAPPEAVETLVAAVAASGLSMTRIGEVAAGAGVEARFAGRPIQVGHAGWRHG